MCDYERFSAVFMLRLHTFTLATAALEDEKCWFLRLSYHMKHISMPSYPASQMQSSGFHLSVLQIFCQCAKKKCKFGVFPSSGWSGQATLVLSEVCGIGSVPFFSSQILVVKVLYT